MKCVKTMRRRTEKIIEAWAKGTKGQIISPIPNDKPIPEDDYFFFGILRGSGDMMKRAKSYYFADHAYFNAGHDKNPAWYRITKNGHVNSSISDKPKDRYEKYFAKTLQPWKTNGSKIIVCPPTGAIEWYFDSKDWIETSIKTLKQHTDREIVVRDKPMNPQVSEQNGITTLSGFEKNKQQKPLEQDLKDAWAVVTFNSSVAIDAIYKGVPVFCGPECSAYPVGGRNLADIENPVRPDREPWLWHLAYNQFTLQEMESGYAYDCIS